MFTQLKSAVVVLVVVLGNRGSVSASNLFGDPGFEIPAPTTTSAQNRYPADSTSGIVWKTSHPSAGNRTIEFWANSFNGVPSAEGKQHIETSAYFRSMVFQPLALTPGQQYDWSFCHRGRDSSTVKDVAEFRIGIPGSLQSGSLPQDVYYYPIVTVSTSNNGATNPPTGPAAGSVTITTLPNGWVKYSGTYTYPNEASATGTVNVGFLSVSSAGGNTNALGNFIDDARIEKKATAEVNCCAKVTAVPYPQLEQSIDYRTFTITNLAGPASPICWIDISFAPSVNHQGGNLYRDSVLVPTATLFVSPYDRIPKLSAGSLSPPAATTVVFNLGVDYTIGWTGSVTFIVHHCDGTTCTLTYGPWAARPPLAGPHLLSVQLLPGRQRVHMKATQSAIPIRWISFLTENADDQLFTSIVATPRGNREPDNIKVEDDGMKSNSVLYAFKQPLKSNQASEPFDLILTSATGAPASPNVIWTTYDVNANPIATGKLTVRGMEPSPVRETEKKPAPETEKIPARETEKDPVPKTEKKSASKQ